MSHPFSVTINRVRCLATEDMTGSDEFVGEMGPVTFPIGTFDSGQTSEPGINKIIPTGEFWLTIVEKDMFDSDDVLGRIDLAADMDVDRSVLIENGSARYEINLRVTSMAD